MGSLNTSFVHARSPMGPMADSADDEPTNAATANASPASDDGASDATSASGATGGASRPKRTKSTAQPQANAAQPQTSAAQPQTNTVVSAETQKLADEISHAFTLKGFSKGSDEDLAMISNGIKTYTLAEGETVSVDTGKGRVLVRCESVEETRVILDVSGVHVIIRHK
jgi:hypothetical protein